MREFIIVGRPNSGKTLFTLNFADYLGSKKIDVMFRAYDGLTTCRHYNLADAKRELCSMTAHTTRSPQSLILNITVGKSTAALKLTDTCGLSESIHQEEVIRRGMAQTLSLLRSAHFIFHIVDLSAMSANHQPIHNNIDFEIYQYGMAFQHYVLLANKIDVPVAQGNVAYLPSVFPNVLIIPISALLSNGFSEVKNHVIRNV